MTLPLSGLRILSVEQYGAGPYGTMFLAQLGAEVIKIEPPGTGDSSRHTGPHFLGEADSLFYQSFNLNKRSMTLDLKAPAWQRIFQALVGTADAVTNNARGDKAAKLGLDYAALGAARPQVVCVHVSAYGRHQPLVLDCFYLSNFAPIPLCGNAFPARSCLVLSGPIQYQKVDI